MERYVLAIYFTVKFFSGYIYVERNVTFKSELQPTVGDGVEGVRLCRLL